MAVSVVSTMRATDAALSTADRVTLTGSMTPSASRSPYFSVAAFSPWPTGSSPTLLTATAPSRPALVAIQYSGALSALENTSTPLASSPESDFCSFLSALRACTSADPPPATMPSSTAALAAATASSTLSLRSLSAVSVAAPTLITATPPDSLASRSCSFSRSQSESVDSISARAPPPPLDDHGVVFADHAAASRSEHVETHLAQRQPHVGVDHLTAGDDGQVLQERLATVAEERRLDRDRFQRLADRVDHQRRQRLALDILGDHQQRFAGFGDLLQQRQQVGQRADLVAVQQDQGVLKHGLLSVEVGDA